MGKPYPFEPTAPAAPIVTPNREIHTAVPHPDDREVIETLRRGEPDSMSGQPLILWDRAEGVNIFDRHGNKWLDFTSGVLVTNAGHSRKEAVEATRQFPFRRLHRVKMPAPRTTPVLLGRNKLS